MSKLIKLSDAVGEALSKRAAEDNLSMAGEVAKLLSVTELPPTPVGTEYFDKKFDELKTLIEDTTVDRLYQGRGGKIKSFKVIPWEVVQDLYHECGGWRPGAKEAFGESDSMDWLTWGTDGETIWSEYEGQKTIWLDVTPEVKEFLNKKGIVWE